MKQTLARITLGLFLSIAGLGHLTWARVEFQAQVPPWLPLDPDFVVVASGVVEIMLGLSLVLVTKYKRHVGWAAAVFFVIIFPGNIAQLVEKRDAFGLDSDLARWLRLPFQPVLIAWALWSTGIWPRKKPS